MEQVNKVHLCHQRHARLAWQCMTVMSLCPGTFAVVDLSAQPFLLSLRRMTQQTSQSTG